MTSAAIRGVGLLGPGLTGWASARRILRGDERFRKSELVPPVPDTLSPREARRTSDAVRVMLSVASEALSEAKLDPKKVPSVFGWARGDGAVVSRILEVLSSDRQVSPTDFHNSVHNAAIGYWAIATGSHEPCSCIAGGDDTFPASLLKALAQVECEGSAVLLVVGEMPLPEPLAAICRIGAPLAAALALSPADQGGRSPLVSAAYECAPATSTPPRTAGLAKLCEGNPVARAIPFLESLARGESASLQLEYGDCGRLNLELECR